jgi:hypothetical protein
MNERTWMAEMHALAARVAGYGVTPDLAALTVAEAWGVFVFLRRLAEAQ